MINQTLIRAIMVLLCIIHLTISCVSGQDGQTDWRAQINDAWQERQNEARTLQFEMRAETRMRKMESRDEFTERTSVLALSFDANKFSLRRKTIAQDGTPQLEELYDSHSTSDGRTSHNYSGTTSPEARGTGSIADSPYPLEATLMSIRPVTLVYRPLNTELTAFDLSNCTLKERDAMVDDKRCWMIVDGQTKAHSGLSYGLWLDPARAFIPLRYQSWIHGDNSVQIDIDYRQDEEIGWIPASWEMTQLDLDGNLALTNFYRVDRAAFNMDIPESEFSVAFPAGTLITNKITGIEYVQERGSNLLAWLILALVIAIIGTFTLTLCRRFWKVGDQAAPGGMR
jgi:hypothetical protein